MEYYKGSIPILEDRPSDRDTLYPADASFGLVERDYDIYPKEMFDAPSGIPIIEESNWDAYYEEEEATQSSLEHLFLQGERNQPAFVNLDQNGTNYCHTADTEVLTEKGWKFWPDYNGSDLLGTMNQITGDLEFQSPLARQVLEYKGETIHSTNNRINFGVTPNHRMLVRKWDESRRTLSDSYSFVTAANLGWYVGLPYAPRGFVGTEFKRLAIEGDREYSGDDFMAMLGLVVSDGYAGGTDNTRNWVSFASFREETRQDIAALAVRLGFHESPSNRGVWIRYNAGALADWIRTNCYINPELKAKNKRVPDLVKCASMRQIEVFLRYFNDRDRSGSQFFSASKRLIDDLQEILLRVGKRSTINKQRAAKDVPYSGNSSGVIRSGVLNILTVSKTTRLCLDRKKHIETDRYNGLVFCATVPNGTLVTRRCGTVLISGNCWGYSTGHAQMITRLIMNEPLIRLNPAATCAILMNGRNDGGWCGLSAKWGRENGYAVEGNGPGQWPGHSRNLKYDTPALRAAMKQHRITEEWVDVNRYVYDQKLTRVQYASALLSKMPCPSDYNFWGHSVCGLRWVRIARGDWGTLILNSWLRWGRFGLAVLRGNQAVPNGALTVRSVTPSLN